ncbi:MAG TPA: response regulator [Longimicrobiales bacterium]|nr:response regulator [Longimicrobiales bacterium]
MSQDDLTARLRATFIDELDEQVRELNNALLRLEQQPGDAEAVRVLFRAAHTVKGAARVAGVPLVEHACHALESVFAAVRDRQRSLDDTDFALCFAVADALADAGGRLRQDVSLDDSPLATLLPRLLEAAQEPPAGEAAAPSSRRGAAPAADRTSAGPGGEDPPRWEPGPVGSTEAGDEAVADADAGGTTPAGEATDAPADVRPASRAADEQVRVRADRLDDLLDAVGELIIATGRSLAVHGRDDEDARRLDAATSLISDVVHSLRLRPFGDICEALPRAVRDVAAAGGKEVALEISGEDVEADRMVMDALREPLLHLVRNAVDHGIETPTEREQQGKPRVGRIAVGAELAGGRLVVTVSDDGGGLDEEALKRSLQASGRRVPERRRELAEELLLGGITTRTEATSFSGRGVGIDLVRTAVERIGGAIDVRWQRGAGTTFRLECPPTPATLRALLFRMGPHTMAIPTTHVERLVRVRPGDVHQSEGRSLITHDGGAVPIHHLAALLGPPLEARDLDETRTAVLVSAGPRRAALVIDEAVAEEEIVVRPLEVNDDDVPHASGAAVLASGQVALLVSVAPLLAAAGRAGTGIAPGGASRRRTPQRRILVADDSITTRTLEQSVLESAGFAVTTAVNGEDAWQRLEADGADLLVADVEMPRMDGIALCRRIRASSRFAELPIVLVTGLGSAEDRARGLEAGADAYIVKSSFDQATLLETVQQLIGDE